MGHPEDEAIRPWFYTWSLMTRLFPKGARIYGSRDRTPVCAPSWDGRVPRQRYGRQRLG